MKDIVSDSEPEDAFGKVRPQGESSSSPQAKKLNAGKAKNKDKDLVSAVHNRNEDMEDAFVKPKNSAQVVRRDDDDAVCVFTVLSDIRDVHIPHCKRANPKCRSSLTSLRRSSASPKNPRKWVLQVSLALKLHLLFHLSNRRRILLYEYLRH